MKKMSILLAAAMLAAFTLVCSFKSEDPAAKYWETLKQAIREAHAANYSAIQWQRATAGANQLMPSTNRVVELLKKANSYAKQTTLQAVLKVIETDPCVADCKKKYAKCCSDCESPTIHCFQECSYNVYDPCIANCPTGN